MTATLTPNWQITIPPQIRKRMRLSVGDAVSFICVGHGRIELIASPNPVTRVRGIVPKPDKPVSLDDMNRAISEGAADGRNRH